MPRTRLPVGVGLEGDRTERHALVELHVAADLAGLADHHARAVIDEEVVADRGPGMDVDAGARVGPLGHHPRDEGHLQAVQQVGEPMDRHRLEAGVAEDDLVERPHGRIAVVGGLHVGGKHAAEVGDALEKLDGLRLPEGFEVALLGAVLHGIRHGGGLDALLDRGSLRRDAVPQGSADLRGELVVQAVDEVTDVVGDVAEMEVLAAPVARDRESP